MASNLRFLCYGLVISALLIAYPAQAKFTCFPFKELFPKMFTAGYAYLGAGALPDGSAVLMFLARDGNFQFVGVDEANMACPLITGDSWQFILGQEI